MATTTKTEATVVINNTTYRGVFAGSDPQDPTRWAESITGEGAANLTAFVRFMIASNLLENDLDNVLYFFEKPRKWQDEYTAWRSLGCPDELEEVEGYQRPGTHPDSPTGD